MVLTITLSGYFIVGCLRNLYDCANRKLLKGDREHPTLAIHCPQTNVLYTVCESREDTTTTPAVLLCRLLACCCICLTFIAADYRLTLSYLYIIHNKWKKTSFPSTFSSAPVASSLPCDARKTAFLFIYTHILRNTGYSSCRTGKKREAT